MVSRKEQEDTVRREVEALHRFLEEWLNGTLPDDQAVFEAGIVRRLHPAFTNIQPAGRALSCGDLLRGLRQGHGGSPDFRIKVRNVALCGALEQDDLILATYEEYQKGARYSAPENARLSSVLFRRDPGGRLIWLHLQETWLPEENHAPEHFGF